MTIDDRSVAWRVPPYDRAVADAEAFIRAAWKIHGIVVAGSIVRGEAGPTSEAVGIACALARRVLGVDTFFEWTSERS